MARVTYDKYNLGQSESKELNTAAQEISIDLCLEPNTYELTFGRVYGQAIDSNNVPVENALIDLMTIGYDSSIHTLTDKNGNYSIENVQPSSYTIFATAKGYKSQEGIGFTITKFQEIERNFILSGESEMALGVIAGDLLDITTNNAIAGGVISLFQGNNDSLGPMVAISYTNEYGQFTFRDLKKGDYAVQASALGYNSVTVNTSIFMDGQIVSMKLMALINNIYQSTVSGMITNDNNYPIDRADVILYQVHSQALSDTKFIGPLKENLTPVAFTRTNERGIYLFAHVPMGTYKVKSNKFEIDTIKID